MILVKNCEGYEILLYLHVNKLACHGFMDSGRRQKFLGQTQELLLLLLLLLLLDYMVLIITTQQYHLPEC